ncbi:MAG: hypothetical protein R2705_01270 [Ilumatobacteraceae bacterium]
MSETAAPQDMLEFASVRTWIESTKPTGLRPVDDRAKRLALIASYCAAVEADPDTIVERSRGDAATKNRYLKLLVDWAAGQPGSDRAKHDAENLIRGFFMRNGFRVVARPYRDVYRRAEGTGA